MGRGHSGASSATTYCGKRATAPSGPVREPPLPIRPFQYSYPLSPPPHSANTTDLTAGFARVSWLIVMHDTCRKIKQIGSSKPTMETAASSPFSPVLAMLYSFAASTRPPPVGLPSPVKCPSLCSPLILLYDRPETSRLPSLPSVFTHKGM